jgi:hypothetical protein
MAGMITSAGISGSLDAADLATAVLTKGIELSNLQSLVDQVNVPNLTGTVPIASIASVSEDLEELEDSDIEGAEFTYVTFDLKKDRVKLAVSDEATYKSRAGDPLNIQINGAGLQLANILDKKVAAAIETNPQTETAGKPWDTVTNNVLYDIGEAVTGVLPYKADFIAMPKAVYTAYLQNDTIKDLAMGNPAALTGAVGRVPGFNLDIFIDDRLTAKSFIVGSSKFCGVLGKGPVHVRKWDAEDIGAMVYQLDVWRQVKSPIYKTAGNTNMAVFQKTAVLS